MGWLSSLIAGLFGTGQQVAQNAYNSKEAEKNRDWQSSEADINRTFQADQAALQRDWSAAEAERARDWNEEMYAKYNSLSGKIAQADQAGVNPLFAVTGNAVSPMQTTASAPSGASATGSGVGSVGNATSSFVDIIGSVLGLKRLESESKVNDALAEKYTTEAEKTGKESAWIDDLSQAQLDNLVASSSELSSRLGVNEATANKLGAEFSKLVQECARISEITSAEKRNLEAQAALAEFQTDNQGLFKGLDLGSDILNMIVDIAVALIEKKTKTTIVR